MLVRFLEDGLDFSYGVYFLVAKSNKLILLSEDDRHLNDKLKSIYFAKLKVEVFDDFSQGILRENRCSACFLPFLLHRPLCTVICGLYSQFNVGLRPHDCSV